MIWDISRVFQSFLANRTDNEEEIPKLDINQLNWTNTNDLDSKLGSNSKYNEYL